MEFESYLSSKHIDSAMFSRAEPALWQSWKDEFEQMHPNSFTLQKLNLINPIRRKYQLPVTETPKPAAVAPKTGNAPAAKPAAPAVPRPGIRIPRPMPKQATPSDAIAPAVTTAVTPTPPSGEIPEAAAPSQAADATTNPDTTAATGPAGIAPEVTQTIDLNPPAVPQVDESTVAKPATDIVKPAPDSQAPGVAKPPRPVIPRPVIKPKPKTN